MNTKLNDLSQKIASFFSHTNHRPSEIDQELATCDLFKSKASSGDGGGGHKLPTTCSPAESRRRRRRSQHHKRRTRTKTKSVPQLEADKLSAAKIIILTAETEAEREKPKSFTVSVRSSPTSRSPTKSRGGGGGGEGARVKSASSKSVFFLLLLLLSIFLSLARASQSQIVASSEGWRQNFRRNPQAAPLSAYSSNEKLRFARYSASASTSTQAQVPISPPMSHEVPYTTFHVTRACEWKSNLFVPKSNDIHFAQPEATTSGPTSGADPQAPVAQAEVPHVVYELNQQHGPRQATGGGGGGEQPEFGGQFGANYPLAAPTTTTTTRTLLSTNSKALVLSLPVAMGQSFGGFEPACSIRLIVPRNMRILAKLTSRRLSFAQEQQQPQQQQQQQPQLQPQFVSPYEAYLQSLASNSQQVNGNQATSQQQASLWLNVSQNQFIETEQRTIETEGNVLAFRFLLDRFAHKQLADLRFQVILTAFQTLGENSDFGGPQPTGPTEQSQQNQQFICDRQRLISSNLVCDGYKNCEDGHDEELATCLTLRPPTPQPPTPNVIGGQQQQPPVRNQMGSGSLASPGDLRQSNASNNNTRSLWARLWPAAARGDSLAGFLLGLLLVLLLALSCCCCCYCGYLLWRHHFRRWWHQLLATSDENEPDNEDEDDRLSTAKQAAGSSSQSSFASSSLQSAQRRRHQLMRAERLADELERDALNTASQQNYDNAQRQASATLARQQRLANQQLYSAAGQQSPQRGRPTSATPPQPPARLHSILKRPGGASQTHMYHHHHQQSQQSMPATTLIPPTSGAPLAAFTPVDSPQRRHLISPSFQVVNSQRVQPQAHESDSFKPTPARRHARSVPPPPPPPPPHNIGSQQTAAQTDQRRHQFRTSPLRNLPTPPPETPTPSRHPPTGSQPNPTSGPTTGSSAAGASTSSASQRVTIYHYSSSKTTHMSESYLEQMAASEHATRSSRSRVDVGVDEPDQLDQQAESTSATRSSLI